jgi:outer membrane protein OmpA-like peptidoglycan-associated protein
MIVSGEQLLHIMGRTLALIETTPGIQLPTPTLKQGDREQLSAELNTYLERGLSARVTSQGVAINLYDIQFRPDSVELLPEEKVKIEEVGRILQRISYRKILVAGHTALAGNEEGRQAVSHERARAVADYLITLGVRRPDEITIEGYGASQPLAPHGSPEQAQNRRVEITILGEP